MPKISALWVAVSLLTLPLSGCHKAKPGAVCSAKGFQSAAIGLVFDDAATAVKSSYRGSYRDKVLSEIKKMQGEGFLQIDNVTFDHFDDKTDAVGCEAAVRYHLKPSDLSVEMKDAKKYLNITGINPPEGLLYGDAAGNLLDYEVRDEAGNSKYSVIKESKISDPQVIAMTSAIIEISFLRQLTNN